MRLALQLLFALAVMSRSVAQQPPELRFAGVFGDHMVVQRDRPLRIWGSAAPTQRVAVQFGAHAAGAVADAEGRWSLVLPALPADATGRELSATADRTVVLRDVVVGDVWLCSGQSNMAMGLDSCDDRSAIATATDGAIRYRPLFEHFVGTPQADLRETFAWRSITPDTAGGCSAVAYWFAQTVRPVAKVPTGLLHCTVGGTEIECWMPPEAFASHPDLMPIAAHLDQAIQTWQRDLAAALPRVETWLAGARAAVAAGRPLAPAPRLPGHPNEDRERWVRCQSLWNGMVHPMLPFGLRGVLWYQGENNGHERTAYAHKLRALVAAWRRGFGAELPFYYVQLPAYGPPATAADGEPGFAPCRMGQLECARLPGMGMAVTIDVGDAVDIHPKDKRTVGERLARWALRGQYGQELAPRAVVRWGCCRRGFAAHPVRSRGAGADGGAQGARSSRGGSAGGRTPGLRGRRNGRSLAAGDGAHRGRRSRRACGGGAVAGRRALRVRREPRGVQPLQPRRAARLAVPQ